MTINFSHFCQLFSGSGQIRKPRQLYLSPGFAKIAPWWLARRDYFLAKVPGLVTADGATNVYSLNRRAVMKNVGVAVNHASSVIFQDYHLILRYLAQLPRQKKM